ncbi:hypothetical protein [Streptomyces sp. PKU-EA00015]|nr:hypothetical protein [Streptomyces sp. PKU-EA00015]
MSQPLPVRHLHVVTARRPTPHMVRTTFGGPGPDDVRLEAPTSR